MGIEGKLVPGAEREIPLMLSLQGDAGSISARRCLILQTFDHSWLDV